MLERVSRLLTRAMAPLSTASLVSQLRGKAQAFRAIAWQGAGKLRVCQHPVRPSRCLFLVLAALCSALAAAQDARPGALVPVYPDELAGLVFVEGEDAVSTNMASEPTLNYGASGNRAIQLARGGKLPGDAPYYAEYVVRIEKAGRYELWYGGTPPGPADELGMSLASPFSLSLDGSPAGTYHREDVAVVEEYESAYYWVRAGELSLEAGSLVLRFEIKERRRADERFFFYLDAFFLVDAEARAALASGASRPEIFPADPAYRGIDRPFRSIEDCEAAIQANPSSVDAYLELSSVHSLLGDYLSALKALSRAAVLAPKDSRIRLLIAKNRIWRADIKGGLEAYRAYLAAGGAERRGYDEAGKVAAWNGRYAEAKDFYRLGLAAFPDDLSFTVNLGLAQLWSSDVREAEKSLAEAERIGLADPSSARRLASILRANGYLDRAVSIYEKALTAFPDRLELYFGQGETWAALDRQDKADEIVERIRSTFAPSPRLGEVLDAYVAKRKLKAERIRALEAGVEADPENLALREELTRVYFWNGYREKAVRQLESILAALFVSVLDESDAAGADLAHGEASAQALRAEAEARLASLAKLSAEAQDRDKALAAAEAAIEAWERKRAAAEAAGKSLSASEGPEYGLGLEAKAAEAGRAFAASLAALRDEAARLALLVERASSIRGAFDAAAERERAEEASFKAIVSASGWNWDARYASSELGIPAARGEELAAYAQARVLAASGDPKGALGLLTGLDSASLAERREAAEFLLRSRLDHREARAAALRALDGQAGSPEAAPPAAGQAARSRVDPRAAAAVELGAIRELLAPALPGLPVREESEDPEPLDPELSLFLRDSLKESLGLLPALRRSAVEAQNQLAYVARASASLRDRRLVRAWRGFEERSLDRKAELGAYYDSLGQAARAATQYRRVLAVDGANITAMYNLALADERRGDWAGASRLLRSVHAADPEYGNADVMHNRIARLHSPSIEVSSTLSADSNRLTYTGGLSAESPLGSGASLRLQSGLDSVRDRGADLPAYLLGRIGLALPLVLDSWTVDGKGLQLTPSASFAGTSEGYAAGGGSSFTPFGLAGSLDFSVEGGLAADWRSGPWYGSASYRYRPVPDSLNPAREMLRSHEAELSAAGYLSLASPLRYLAPRLYAKGSYVVDDGNLLGTLLVEAIPALRLSDSPWANLGLPLVAVFEHSAAPGTEPYYAADGALTLKTGLLWQSTWGLSELSISISLQALGGLYRTKVLTEPSDPSLYAQLYGRLDLARGEASYWLGFELTATDPLADPMPYFSVSLLGGLSARQPRLIAP